MTDEELIARLTSVPADGWGIEDLCQAAADRIEALVKERDRYLRHLTAGAESLRRFEARAERLEAALRLLHDNVVLAFPTLADLGPVANARAALKGADHE